MELFKEYIQYVGKSESPTIYHRWALISIIGALLGRQTWFPFGHFVIYPNQYIVLTGTAGARKSSALDIAKNLLKDSGYSKLAPSRTSKECLLVEMQKLALQEFDEEELENLTLDEPSEIYICKGELVDFLGINDLGFLLLLTDLWDNLPDYSQPKITKKSVHVHKPTISILGGATPHSIAMAIPTEVLELGFTSRILFIFSEPTGVKITIPAAPCQDKRNALIEKFLRIKETIKGAMIIDEGVEEVLDRMYNEFRPLEDARFSKYSARRFTHLLKLSMIIAASDERTIITKRDCIEANTILHAAELKMPKALGEFGKSRYSNVSNMIIEHLSHASRPITTTELWKLVCKDLTEIPELTKILKNLQHSDKIQVVTVKDRQGYVIKNAVVEYWKSDLLDESILMFEERGV